MSDGPIFEEAVAAALRLEVHDPVRHKSLEYLQEYTDYCDLQLVVTGDQPGQSWMLLAFRDGSRVGRGFADTADEAKSAAEKFARSKPE